MDPNIRNRGVQAQVSRDNLVLWPEEDPLADSNNNLARVIINPTDPQTYPRRNNRMDAVAVGVSALPPVSTTLALLQLFLYHIREQLNVKSEEDVYVSWKTVITDQQYWRVFCAHFFHFGRVHLFINFITLISIGRYLEKKLNKPAMLVIVQLMGMMSNMLYILLNSYFCVGTHNEFTYGFSNLGYALRVILAYAQEPRNYEVALAFGLWPFELQATWAPWQPLVEVVILKVVIPEVCMTGSISGICTGFFFSFIILAFPVSWHTLMDQSPPIEPNQPPLQPPPPFGGPDSRLQGPPTNENQRNRRTANNEDNPRNNRQIRTTPEPERPLPQNPENHRASAGPHSNVRNQRLKSISNYHKNQKKTSPVPRLKYRSNVLQRHTVQLNRSHIDFTS